jgi:hypothetical protein
MFFVVGLLALAAAWPAAADASARKSAGYYRVALSQVLKTPGGAFPLNESEFTWALDAQPGIIDGPLTSREFLLKVTGHSCRSIHLDFSPGQYSAYLQVNQRGRPAVSKTVPSSQLGSIDAPLTPRRAWSLVGATPSIAGDVYVNGWASCKGTAGRWRQPHLATHVY